MTMSSSAIGSESGYSLSHADASKPLINVSPGPAPLPREVVVQLGKELSERSQFQFGAMPMELSHRSPEFARIQADAEALLREVMSIPEDKAILFVPGGGHGQFAAVPLNLVRDPQRDPIDYVISGVWSAKAFLEAKKYAPDARKVDDTHVGDRPIVEGKISATERKRISDKELPLNLIARSLEVNRLPEDSMPSVGQACDKLAEPLTWTLRHEQHLLQLRKGSESSDDGDISNLSTADSFSCPSPTLKAHDVDVTYGCNLRRAGCKYGAGYVYMCSNETVNGIEFREDGVPLPGASLTRGRPLVVDMCADFLTKRVDWQKVAVGFACFSKNLGLAGGCVVVVDKGLLEDDAAPNTEHVPNNIDVSLSDEEFEDSIMTMANLPPGTWEALESGDALSEHSRSTSRLPPRHYETLCPSILSWREFWRTNSLYQTPATYSIYVLTKILQHFKARGGLPQIEQDMEEKARLVYEFLDDPQYPWIRPFVPVDRGAQRSRVNIPFYIVSENEVHQESMLRFLQHCFDNNVVGLRTKTPFQISGHCEALRISLYVGITVEDVKTVIRVWSEFRP